MRKKKVGLLRSKWRGGEARSEVAGAALDGVLRKRDYAGLSDFVREGSAFLACGNAAGVFSVLFTVDPLEQDV